MLSRSDQPQSAVEILPPPSGLFQGQTQTINIDDQISSRGGNLEDDNNMQRPEFGQVIDVNLSPWTEFYPTGIYFVYCSLFVYYVYNFFPSN